MNYFLIQHISPSHGRFITQLHYTVLSSHIDNPDDTDHCYWNDMIDIESGVLIDFNRMSSFIREGEGRNQKVTDARIRILRDIENYIISQREQIIDEII